MKTELAGKFIVIDGPDGCGKSTQAELLTQWLNQQGLQVERFRDPGGTVIGEKIREILLNPEHGAMSTETEVLLYLAARSQLWTECISPAIKNNHCVVLDRWLSSTLAYQGWAGGFGIEKIIKIASDCFERIWPDLTIILDVDQKTASGRLNRQLDRMEAKGEQYEIEQVHKQIVQIISEVSFV